MGQARPDLITVIWENPPGPAQGALLVRRFRGQHYERRVSPQDWLTQIETAAVLGTTLMSVNRYVRSGALKDRKRDGISMIRLGEIKRFVQVRKSKKGGVEGGARVPFLT